MREYHQCIDVYMPMHRKVVKKIKIGEVQPNETIEAVKEATLLSQVYKGYKKCMV